MTEETTTQAQKPEESLEELYAQASASITKPATEEQLTQPQTQTGYEAAPPDPVADSDAFRKWAAEQSAVTQNEIAKLRHERAQEAQSIKAQAEQRDFQDAVSRLAKDAEIPDEQRDLVEGYLMAKASRSEALRGLWEARAANPQAWGKALSSLTSEIRGKLAIQRDDQVAENQRALDDAMRSQSSTAPPEETEEQRVAKMNPQEFDQYWRRKIGRTY